MCVLCIRLSGGILAHPVKCSSEIRLPSLKTLQLNIGYVEVACVNAFLSCCPILENLDLCYSPKRYSRPVQVPPSLKKLKITIENDVYATLEINAPGLKYLNLTNMTTGNRVNMYNFHNVVEAYLDLYPLPQVSDSIFTLLNFLRSLYRAKHLVLGRSTTKVKVFNFFNFFFLCIHKGEVLLSWFIIGRVKNETGRWQKR